MNQRNAFNPFVLGGVVTGKHFAGRASEIERLRSLALGGQHAYLFAPRRYGKTSLLKETLYNLQETNSLIVVWCDCLPTTDVQSLAMRLAEEVVHAARGGKLAEWGKTAGSLFKRLRPSVSVTSDGRVTVGLDMAPSQTPLPDLEDALAAVARLSAMKKQPIALVFDEFQQIAEWDKGHQTEAVVRTAIQHFSGVSCIFAGSERHLLQQMFSDRARPLFQLAAPFPIGRLSTEELSPWLKQRFGESGLRIDIDPLRMLVAIAAGHPGATQFLAHFVWETATAQSAPAITTELVQEALTRAVDAGDTIYGADYSRLTAAQRQVLAAFATEPTLAPTAAEYLRRHRLPSKSTVNQAVKSLVEKGHLEDDKAGYLVSDPLFAEWIRRLHVVTTSLTIGDR